MLVAACGPRSLQLAAHEADGVVLNWLTAADLDRVDPLPHDRSRVSLVLPVCVTTEPAIVDAVMRPVITDYLNAPAYAEQQRRVGRGAALEPMWSAWARGDRKDAYAQLPSAILDELVISGHPNQCREQLDTIERRTGVRAIATYFLPPGAGFVETALAGRTS